jgi:hypothetical protein
MQVTKRPFRYNFSGNSIFYELSSDAAIQNSLIYFEVIIFFKRADDNAYYQVNLDPLIFTPVNGKALFDISDYLDGMMDYEMPPLSGSLKNSFVAKKQSGEFYITFREVDPALALTGFNTSEFNFKREVLKGGVDRMYYRGNNYFRNYLPAEKPYLSWLPKQQLVAMDQMVYLVWFHSIQVSGVLQQKIEVEFDDGEVFQTQNDIIGGVGSVIYMPAGVRQLQLDNIRITKRIVRYSITFGAQLGTDAFNVICEKINFEIDNRNSYQSYNLLYRNSLGGIDSVMVRSRVEKVVEYELTEASSVIAPDYYLSDTLPSENKIVEARETLIYRGSITQLSKEAAERTRDIFFQREVYWPRFGKFWPVKVLNKGFSLGFSNDKRWSLPIEWQYALEGNKFYTPEGLDLGPGEVEGAGCAVGIQILPIEVTFDGQLANVVFRYNLLGGEAPIVRWWIPGSVDPAREHQTFQGNSFSVNLPIGNLFTVFMQTICVNGELGPIEQRSFSTSNAPTGPIIIDPVVPPGNVPPAHQIVNQSSARFTFSISGTGQPVIGGELDPGQSIPLPASLIGMNTSRFNVAVVGLIPSSATAQSESVGPVNGFVITLDRQPVTQLEASIIFRANWSVQNWLQIIIR